MNRTLGDEIDLKNNFFNVIFVAGKGYLMSRQTIKFRNFITV